MNKRFNKHTFAAAIASLTPKYPLSRVIGHGEAAEAAQRKPTFTERRKAEEARRLRRKGR